MGDIDVVTRIHGDFDNNPIYTQGSGVDNQDEKRFMRDMRAAGLRRQPDCVLICGRKKKEEHFSVFQAGKEFVKGLFRPIETMLKHPIIAAGSLIGLGILTSVAPITIPILTVLGFGLGINQIFAGIVKATVNYHLGNYKDAEKAFGDIAEGSVAIGGTAAAMKTAGAIATEAKTTAAVLKNAESAGDKIAAVEQGVDAGIKVQQGSWANAFRQTHSVITSPRAIWNQLNPRTLFNTGLDKGRSLVEMFRNEPVLSKETVNNAERTAQAHLGINNDDMPKGYAAPTLDVLDNNYNLVESDIRYGVDTNSGLMATHHNQAFYSPIDDRLHIETNGFQHAKNAVSKFPFLQKLMDSSPKPIQNFLGNLALKRISPERLFTQELSKKRQFQSLKHLSTADYGAALQEVYNPEWRQLPTVNTSSAQSQEAEKVYIDILKAEKAGLKVDPDSTLAEGRGLLPHISNPIEINARNDANALFKRQILGRLQNTESNYKADASSALRDAREYAMEKRLNEGLKEWNDIAASDASRKNKKLKRVESKLQATRSMFGANSPTADLLKSDQQARNEYAFQQKTRGRSAEDFQGDLPEQHNHDPRPGEFPQSHNGQTYSPPQDELFYHSAAPAKAPKNPTVDEVISGWSKGAPTATELTGGDTVIPEEAAHSPQATGHMGEAAPKPLHIIKKNAGGESSGQPEGSARTTQQTPSPMQPEPTTPPSGIFELGEESTDSATQEVGSKQVEPATPKTGPESDTNSLGKSTASVPQHPSEGSSANSASAPAPKVNTEEHTASADVIPQTNQQEADWDFVPRNPNAARTEDVESINSSGTSRTSTKNTPKIGEAQSSASEPDHRTGSLPDDLISNASDSDDVVSVHHNDEGGVESYYRDFRAPSGADHWDEAEVGKWTESEDENFYKVSNSTEHLDHSNANVNPQNPTLSQQGPDLQFPTPPGINDESFRHKKKTS